jgi:hypothetical protein
MLSKNQLAETVEEYRRQITHQKEDPRLQLAAAYDGLTDIGFALFSELAEIKAILKKAYGDA